MSGGWETEIGNGLVQNYGISSTTGIIECSGIEAKMRTDGKAETLG